MRRLIDVPDALACRSPLALMVGDVVSVAATGGRIGDGTAVELLGPFLPAVIGDTGGILSPVGTPGTVLLLARRSGSTRVELVTGDPWGAHRTVALELVVSE